MLITADWVLPVSRPPLRNGAVLLRHGQVAEVGDVESLASLNSDGEQRDFPGCIVSPGLVNAHTHLSLTALGGLLAPAPFEEWLPRLVTAMGAWDKHDHAASAALGAVRCLEAGVTVVGDIAYGPEAASVAADMGMGGTFYWEVLGIAPPRLFGELEALEFPHAEGGWCGLRLKCGLSPHSPYTAGPSLIRLVHETAMELGVPLVMHLAESAAEVELLEQGTGALSATAQRLAHGFEVPHASPVTYIDRLDVLSGMTLVHAGHIGPADVARIAAGARGVIACPRSNAFLSNPVAPVVRLGHAGVPLGLGTDSSASNVDLDLMKEVRALHAEHPSIPARTLIEYVTMQGAIVLAQEERFGILEPGLQGDLAIFAVGPTDDPETAFVQRAGADTLTAVIAGGNWRVLDGRPVDDVREIFRDAQAARVRAERALEG